MIRDWDRHFMSVAQLNAEMGTCRRRKVGAVAVLGRRQLAAGFNGNLPGAVHCTDGGCARCASDDVPSGVGLERCVCVHAEQSLVAWVARYGIRLDGSTVYLTLQPCSDCAKLLVSAGVVEVIYDAAYDEDGFVFTELAGINVRRFTT